MSSSPMVRLLDLDPEVGTFLSAEDRSQARQIVVPVRRIASGDDLEEQLRPDDGFAAIVLDGMLLQRLGVGNHVGLRVVGPGDVISLMGRPRSMLVGHTDCRVVATTRLALLGRELESAVGRWPALLPGLHCRLAEQSDRLATQLVICQLPRVDQRVLAIMWLLAESWGQVTAAGTSLPITLTHELLGGLIGARRSTVTQAIGELADRGAMIRQGRGWLLLERPPEPTEPPAEFDSPRPLDRVAPGWHETVASDELTAVSDELVDVMRVQLTEAVARLREEHLRNKERVRTQLEGIARTREQSLRRRRARRQIRARSAPS